MELHLISTVFRYESKALGRSWILCFFALLVFVGISLLQVATQSSWSITEHYMTALPSSLPFLNVYLFNLLQALLLVFIVADRFKTERNADTLESLRVRPVDNLTYLVGKALGIFIVFVVLNIISLLIALFINVFASDSPVNAWIYLFYLITLTIPSCIFMLGLIFLIYSLVKNAILALLVSVVILVVIYAFTSSPGYGIFDPFARELPNMFSELTGHAGMGSYLLHRLVYLFLGSGLLVIAAALYPRIANRNKEKIKLYGGSLVLLGVVFGGLFVGTKEFDNRFRGQLVEAFKKYSSLERAYLSDAELTFEQSGSSMSVTSRLTLQNKRDRGLPEIVLFLNPALKISGITDENGTAIPYRRDKQVVFVEKNLDPGREITLRVDYAGKIDDRVSYLDIPNAEYHNNRWITGIFCFGKRYAYLEKGYTLLEPEVLWYPVAEPPVDWVQPCSTGKNYTGYTLNVIHKDDHMVISQGKQVVSGDTIRFKNAQKLTGISLCMGDYTHKSLMVDSVELDLYFYRGENYFFAPFSTIVDTIPSLLLYCKDLMERPWGYRYLYDRLSILETPVSFGTYTRGWSKRSNNVQPAMIFIPERGVTVPEIVNSVAKEHERGMQVNTTRISPQQDLQGEDWVSGAFVTCVKKLFIDGTSEFIKIDFDLLMKKQDAMGSPLLSKVYDINKYKLSSLFQDNGCSVVSSTIQVASLLFDQFQIMTSPAYKIQFSTRSIIDYLSSHSLEDAANDPNLSPKIFELVLLSKCSYLYDLITMSIPPKTLSAFMENFLEKYKYQQVTLEQFMREFEEQFNYNLSETFNSWYKSKGCSPLAVKDVKGYKVEKGDYEGYIVSFKVNNPGKVDILFSATISADFLKGARGYYQNIYLLPVGETREIRVLCGFPPGNVYINPHLALNQPGEIVNSLGEIDKVIDDSTQGVFSISSDSFLPDPNEIIVDNEDEGFSLFDSNGKRLLKNRDKRDTGYEELKSGNRWTYMLHSTFYGQYIKSLYYKKSGSGKAMAEWKTELDRPGKYEVFIYNVNGGLNEIGDGLTQYYTLYHRDKKEEIEFTMDNDDRFKWVSVGTFSFDTGEARIVLSDKSDQDIVYADAVKWVYVGEE